MSALPVGRVTFGPLVPDLPRITLVHHVCDVCGAPATTVACDRLRHDVPGEPQIRYTPLPTTRRGCDQHPAEARTIEHVTNLP